VTDGEGDRFDLRHRHGHEHEPTRGAVGWGGEGRSGRLADGGAGGAGRTRGGWGRAPAGGGTGGAGVRRDRRLLQGTRLRKDSERKIR
jgi:hypothetical protein